MKIDTEVIDNVANATTLAVGAIGNNATTFVVERTTFRGNSASAMAANGLAVGTIGTGFFAAARTTLTRSRVVANRAQGGTATGGLHQISGNGIYVLERTEIARNTPGDCNFGCQP